MAVWMAALFGVLLIGLGAARIQAARSSRRASLPWSRREDHADDFSSKRAPYDQARTDSAVGAGLVAVGLIVITMFAVLPALR